MGALEQQTLSMLIFYLIKPNFLEMQISCLLFSRENTIAKFDRVCCPETSQYVYIFATNYYGITWSGQLIRDIPKENLQGSHNNLCNDSDVKCKNVLVLYF